MLLEAKDLYVRYRLKGKHVHAVNGVSLSIDYGDAIGIVGESGCGKTTLLKARICLLPSNADITSGEIIFEGKDLRLMPSRELRKLRWKEFSIIPQSAMNALDPVYTIKEQIVEAMRVHGRIEKHAVVKRLQELFELVGLEETRLNSYPHQLSGGMRQRAAIAMALALNPKLVIADEPTTALDVVTQRHILEEIKSLQVELGLALIYVTHDIYVVAETCKKVAVMYAGKIVEFSPRDDIFDTPMHPYTAVLQMAFPSIHETKKLISLSGYPPDMTELPKGCKFLQRCPFTVTQCAQEDPPLREMEENRYVACFRAGEIEDFSAFSKED